MSTSGICLHPSAVTPKIYKHTLAIHFTHPNKRDIPHRNIKTKPLKVQSGYFST